jgi:hypothetical protein
MLLKTRLIFMMFYVGIIIWSAFIGAYFNIIGSIFCIIANTAALVEENNDKPYVWFHIFNAIGIAFYIITIIIGLHKMGIL